jgi:hypothetical protein
LLYCTNMNEAIHVVKTLRPILESSLSLEDEIHYVAEDWLASSTDTQRKKMTTQLDIGDLISRGTRDLLASAAASDRPSPSPEIRIL